MKSLLISLKGIIYILKLLKKLLSQEMLTGVIVLRGFRSNEKRANCSW